MLSYLVDMELCADFQSSQSSVGNDTSAHLRRWNNDWDDVHDCGHRFTPGYAGNRFSVISHYLGVASGMVSLCFGSFLVYQLGFVGGLFTSQPRWTPQ